MIIGDKRIFAVAFEIVDYHRLTPLGYGCVWVNNIQIGYYDEVNFLIHLLDLLKSVLAQKESNPKFIRSTAKETFDQLVNGGIETGTYFFQGGEAFDDFTTCTVKTGSDYTFLWKLGDKPFFKYGDYDHEVKSGTVPESYLRPIVEEFAKHCADRQV